MSTTPAHYLWAVLIARIFEVFPLLCSNCVGQMRLIALLLRARRSGRYWITSGSTRSPPHLSPARGPPLCEDCGDAQMDDGAQIEPDWDQAAQAAPDCEVDQRVNW